MAVVGKSEALHSTSVSVCATSLRFAFAVSFGFGTPRCVALIVIVDSRDVKQPIMINT